MDALPPRYSGRYGQAVWDHYWRSFSLDSTKIATYELTVRNTLDLLTKEDCQRPLEVLDLGCGQGDIDILLALRTDFRVTAVDISDLALRIAADKTRSWGLQNRIRLCQADAYHLCFPSESFDVVISFGYGSVGGYLEAQSEVRRVLRGRGVAIIDFKNLSLYNTLLTPRQFVRLWERYRRGEPKMYHLGIWGLKAYFRRFGLELEKSRAFNTYPPIGAKLLPPAVFLAFEGTLGRLLRPLLGRVFLAKFRKVD